MRLFIVILLSLSVTACGGRNASPITVARVGDSQLRCDELISEMATLDSEARKKLGKDARKTGQNVGLGVAGVFLLVPFFFMDFSEAERIEAEALRDRYLPLQRLANRKNCEF